MTIDPLLGKSVKEAVTSPAIRDEIDRFLRKKTWQEPTSLAWTTLLGVALIVASVGLMLLLSGSLTLFGFVLCLGTAVLLGLTSFYGQNALAILTRTGLWDQTILQTTSALVDYLYLYGEGADRDYQGKVSTLLALLAAAPSYISDAERFDYWCDTLDELRYHASATRALVDIRQRHHAARQRLNAVQGDTQPAQPAKRWGLFPAPTPVEDPLVRTARVQLEQVESEERTLTAYLDRIAANVAARRRELGRAIAATELYLDMPTEALLLPALRAVEPLPHPEALRDLLPDPTALR